MAYKYTGDGILGISLNVNSPKPLDIRSVVNSTKDLYEIPKNTAYEGMTVANLADGNLYMLVDVKNIDKKAGWRASYESLQIISCTAEEYALWLDNTNIEGDYFSPKDESIEFIHSNTYYYVEEDSGIVNENGELIQDSQDYYITRSWIENALKAKASTGTTDTLASSIQQLSDNINSKLSTDYSTTIQIQADYYSKLQSDDLFYSKSDIDSNFYTKQDVYSKSESDDLFVTRDELRGGLEGGSDDFVFVTKTQYDIDNETHDATYAADKESIQKAIDDCVKSNSEAQLTSIQVSSILNPSGQIDITADGLTLNSQKILTEDGVEKHTMMTYEQYNQLAEKEEDTYYYIYDDSIPDGWVLKSTLNAYYTKQEAKSDFYTKQEVNDLLDALRQELSSNTNN